MKYVSVRVQIALMIFVGTFMTYLIRVDLAILIISLIEKIDLDAAACAAPNPEEYNEYYDEDEPTLTLCKKFKWTPNTRGKLLAAYFIGYAVGCFPSGLLIQRFGPKRVVSVTMLVAAAFCSTIPIFVFTRWSVVFVMRLFIGLCSGVTYPAFQHLVMAWAPLKERGRFMCGFLGGSLGTAVSWAILGSSDEFCWIIGFLCSGSVAILLVCLFMYFVYDNPEEHPRISLEEKLYLKNVMPAMEPWQKCPPMLKILKSGPFWALVVLHFGNTWTLYFSLTEDPTYMHTVLGFNLGQTGAYSALAHVARVFGGLIFGFLADWIQSKNCFSTTNLRKVLVVFSHIIPGVALIMEIYAVCDETLDIIINCISLGFNGATLQTSLMNCHDIFPNFASTAFGMVNGIGAIPGIIIPLLVGGITERMNTLINWRRMYVIGGGIYLASGFLYLCLGSGNQMCCGKKQEVAEEGLSEGRELEEGRLEENRKGHLQKGDLEEGHLEERHIEQGHIEEGHIEEGHLEEGYLDKGYLEGQPEGEQPKKIKFKKKRVSLKN